MKGYIRYAAALLALVLATGCIAEMIVSPMAFVPEEDGVLEFGSWGGYAEVSFTGGGSWTASAEKSWCTVTPAKGRSDGTVVIAVMPSLEYDARECQVTITDGRYTLTVDVRQERKATLGAVQADYVVPAEGGTVEVKALHNVGYDVTVCCDGGWISETTSKGLTKTIHTFNVLPNEGYDDREAAIVFHNAEEYLSDTVTVLQLKRNAIVAADQAYVLEAQEGRLEFVVASNVDFAVTVKDSWIRQETDTKGLVESRLAFLYDANSAFEDRTTEIVLSYKDISQTIAVTQKGNMKEYRLAVLYTGSLFTLPSVNGGYLSGSIYWGDGTSSGFADEIASHEYSTAGEYRVEYVLTGSDDPVTVEFSTISGITEIDLSGL